MSEQTPFDVLIVGGGPGGIAAAVTAATRGLRVGLVDEAPFAGEQIWRNLGKPKARAARQWIDRLDAAVASGAVQWFRQSRVVAKPSASTLLVEVLGKPESRTVLGLIGHQEIDASAPWLASLAFDHAQITQAQD